MLVDNMYIAPGILVIELWKRGYFMTGILNIQLKPAIGKKDVNLKKVEYYISKNSDKKLDLVVIPEFFSTGVDHQSFLNAPEDEFGGETVKFISELAKKYKTNIVAGTVIEKSQDKLYNTSFVINRDGEVVEKYRKIHLYNYMGGTEGDRITPGDKYITADLDFGKIGIGICFDIRYPQHYRKLAQMGAEIIVLPTAWLVPTEIYEDSESKQYAQEMWVAMNRTRAYDNMVYIVSSNQAGKINDNISGLGASLIVAPTAQILADAKDEQGAVYADVDLDGAKYLRSLYPITSIE